MHPASRLPTALLGVALILVGTALAINFRGLSIWWGIQATGSTSWAERPLRRIQPWKAQLEQPPEDRLKRQVWVLRIIGASFAVAGVALFLYGAFGIGQVTTN